MGEPVAAVAAGRVAAGSRAPRIPLPPPICDRSVQKGHEALRDTEESALAEVSVEGSPFRLPGAASGDAEGPRSPALNIAQTRPHRGIILAIVQIGILPDS